MIDRTWGFGAAVRASRVGQLQLSLALDHWGQPGGTQGAGEARWNATAEMEASGDRCGVAVKAGSKSDGFFPGLPADEGFYLGAGVMASW